jgi:hypothetical protein
MMLYARTAQRPHLFQQEVPGFDISKKKNSLAKQLAQE